MDTLLLIALYAGEAAVALLMLCIYKQGDQPAGVYLTTTPGRVGIASLVVICVSLAVVVWRYQIARRAGTRTFALNVAMNVASLTLILIAGEIAIRGLSVPIAEGTPLFNDELLLMPRDWNDVAANYRAGASSPGEANAFLSDPVLGWTMRPNYHDKQGMYHTSAEGLRSTRAGVVYRDRAPQRRIALIGDSFTFANDVHYEDSWGYQLESTLGNDTQVLNFGVTGFGIDQAYLNYEHAVKSWRPDIVIFGVFPDDLERAMAVYPFIRRPRWEIPFAKPRLLPRDGRPVIVNAPVLPPQEVFAHPDIKALPHLAYDRGYKAEHWDRHALHAAYLVRFFVSRFPRWTEPSAVNDDAAMERLALAIFNEFTRSAGLAGSRPVLAYLPSRQDVAAHNSGHVPESAARRVLLRAGIEHLDLTPCVAGLPQADRYLFGGAGHFTPRANAAVAECIAQQL